MIQHVRRRPKIGILLQAGQPGELLRLSVHSSNASAIALYKKLGFEIEGVLRRHQFIVGSWVDLTLMAIMQGDRLR